MGIGPIALTDEDIERIEEIAEAESGTLIDTLGPDQRAAVQAHVIDQRGYVDIALDLDVSEAVVRQRVSRGLAVLRRRIGSKP
jgi:RNA polymerase sigma-70 factor (ECF subfamily)